MPARCSCRTASDALLAGAEIALAVEQRRKTSGSPDTVGTTGVFRIEPGAVNSVPCRAWLEIDLRDTQVQTRDEALEKIEHAASRNLRAAAVSSSNSNASMSIPLRSATRASLKRSERLCGELDVSVKRMISRAYHDSLFMAAICPTTMIFIPCRGGVSHRPDEYSSPEQIAMGVRVLAQTLANLSS